MRGIYLDPNVTKVRLYKYKILLIVTYKSLLFYVVHTVPQPHYQQPPVNRQQYGHQPPGGVYPGPPQPQPVMYPPVPPSYNDPAYPPGGKAPPPYSGPQQGQPGQFPPNQHPSPFTPLQNGAPSLGTSQGGTVGNGLPPLVTSQVGTLGNGQNQPANDT